MKKRILAIITTYIITTLSLFSNNNEIDSLKNLITSTNSTDTTKLSALLSLGETIYQNNLDSALLLFEQAKQLGEKFYKNNKDKKIKKAILLHLSTAYNNIGFIYSIKGDILQAMDNYLKSLNLRKKVGNKKKISYSLINIGYVYYSLGDMTNAIKYFMKALKYKEELNDTKGIIIARNNIAYIYGLQGDTANALRIYKKNLEYAISVKNTENIPLLYHNIATLYLKKNNIDSASYYLKYAIKINTENNHKLELTQNYITLSTIYRYKHNIDSAIYYLQQTIAISNKLKNTPTLTTAYSKIANLYLQQGKIKKAEQFAKIAYNHAKQLGYPSEIKIAAELLKNIYTQTKDYKQAFHYYTEEIRMNDSISNQKNQKTLYQQQYKYQYEKKAAIDSLNHIKEIKIKNLEIKRQAIQRNSLIIILLITIIFAIATYKNYKQKAKLNNILQEQKEELISLNENLNQQNEEIRIQRDQIENQKELLETLYNELSQSINYAQNLQTNIFPNIKTLTHTFPDSFIIFKPKDKVSGDFYWWAKIKDTFIITVADCTGHGVPGALLSMLGISMLREVVIHLHITQPDKILRLLKTEIIRTLKQKGQLQEHKDGIDMAILSIDLHTQTAIYAGANNRAYYLTQHQIEEKKKIKLIKTKDSATLYALMPDKMPVGIHPKNEPFTSISIPIHKGDTFYLLSDGIVDQFGGPKGKKFKHTQLIQLLLNNYNKTMNEQKIIIEETIKSWSQGYEQIDDITIVGIRT